jgi:hypothetical protein
MASDTNDWRTAAISLAFLLVLVCVAWVMREQSVAADCRREREQWQHIEEGRRLADEERSRLIERLDLALDEVAVQKFPDRHRVAACRFHPGRRRDGDLWLEYNGFRHQTHGSGKTQH